MLDLTRVRYPLVAAMAEHWREAVADASRTISLDSALPRGGDPRLRQVLADLTGAEVSTVTISSGVRAAAAPLVGARDLLLERPTFADIALLLDDGKRTITHVGWEELASLPPDPFVAVWVTSPFRNPDGRSLCAAESELLGTWARAGATVVVNAEYAWFASWPSRALGTSRVSSLHKLLGPATRLGWVEADELAEETARRLWAGAPPPLWQRAWAVLLATPAFHEAATELDEQQRVAGSAFVDALGEYEVTWLPAAPGSPHLLLPVPDTGRAIEVLAAAGVAVNPGEAFAATTPAVRASFLGLTPGEAARGGEIVGRTLRRWQ